MLMTFLIRVRVFFGAWLLDRVHPHWSMKIDRVGLDFSCGGMCILGQLYGNYGKGLIALQRQVGSHEEHWGFAAPIRLSGNQRKAERALYYTKLTEAWRRKISQREGRLVPRRAA